MSNSFFISLVLHTVIVAVFLVLMNFDHKKEKQTISFSIVEKQAKKINKKPKIRINTSKPKKTIEKVKQAKKQREVFGVKRNTIVNDTGSINVKVGNTVTKKEDEKVLRDDEADTLPDVAEEYLITSMPRAIKEIRPKYPKWAKEQKITGSVVFDILIDQNGEVRQALLVKGIHPELDTLAKDAIIKFKFKPAFIDKKPAAVRIKYAIKYLLES